MLDELYQKVAVCINNGSEEVLIEDIDIPQLTNQQWNKLLKEKRKNCLQAILEAEHFNDALQCKLALEAEGVPADIDIYYELLSRCNNYQTVCELKEEMMSAGCALDERIYRCLIKKMSSSTERQAILREMIVTGINPTIKTYFVLIRNAENIEQALALFSEMKERNISFDVRIYWELIRIARGTEYHRKIISEIHNFEQLQALITEDNTYMYIQLSVQKAKEWGLEYDVEFLNDMFLNLHTPDDIVSLLNLIEQEGVSYNHRTYIAFLQAYREKGDINDIQNYMKRIEAQLSSDDYAKFFAWYKQEPVIEGGLGKVNIKNYQIINELKQEIVHEEDFNRQFFQLGVIDGLDSESTDFAQGIEEALEEIKMLESEAAEDLELFTHSIEFQQGVVEGIKKRQAIYCNIRDKHMPILVIAYVTDEEALALLRKQALLWKFYEYDLGNIDKYEVMAVYLRLVLQIFRPL